MATQKIEYQNKVAIDDVGVPEKNKITAENMNEIKEVVNNNADNADETTAAINSRIDTANNAINNIVENTYTKTETDEKLAQKADISDIPTDLSQLSNATTKFVNETQLQEETTARENADNDLQGQIDAIVASSDVVDIVGTYQELENYDTSHLGDNDIIKVLQDSTHNNATSYYRWKKQSSTWQYIGSEGPYYTKSESNEKFVEKETGKGLSTNDFTNADKNKLDGIESEAEVNIIEKVKVNNTDLPIENKEVNINLADYVKNTDYATTSKGGVIRVVSAYGYNVSNANGGIYPNLRTKEQYDSDNDYTFIGKGTLENVITGKLLVNQETLEESQASQDEIIAKLKADHPEIEEEGTELSLQGTGDFELALSPKGNITQETREGINLCPPNFVTSSGTTNKGITLTHSNGIITLNGTATEQVSFGLHWTLNMEAGSYTWKMFGMPSDCFTNYYNIGNVYGENVGTKTVDNTANLGLQITIPSGKTLNNVVIKPMLVSGTYTNQTFPPYEQYGASPSPSYPSPVKVVDGEYEVEVENKNLCKSAIVNATSSAYVDILYVDMDLKPNTTYTISFIGNTNNNIYLNENITTSQYITCNGSRQSLTFTTKSNLDKTNNKQYKLSANGWILFKNNSSNTETPSFDNVQIEYGTTATPYTPHAEQTQTIDTSPNPLYSENDYYYKSNGEWYVHNEWGKLVFNGSENTWLKSSNTSVDRFYMDNFYGLDNANSKCNYFTKAPLGTTIGCWWNNQNIQIGFNFSEPNTTTLEQWKTWLGTHNLVLVQPLATPTNTPITNTTLINQLETFQNMLAYQDQTNISQTHNEAQADMIINAKTIMSLRYMQSEIENLSSRLALLE